MVWRKVILSFILICCILLVAASGSPANAAEEQNILQVEIVSSVPMSVVEVARDILMSNYLGRDYLLCCSNTDVYGGTYVLFIGNVEEKNQEYLIIPEVLYVLAFDSNGFNVTYAYPSQLGLDRVVCSNLSQFIIYSNVGSNLSLIDWGVVYAFATLVLLATGIVCYLLRSVFDFCLRRQS